MPSLLVDRAHVRESDAETLAALVAGRDGDDVLVHLRWRETLGRDALCRRFYRDLEGCVETLAITAIGRTAPEDRRTVALLTTSRLLFLSFLEAKGWLDEDRAFLRHGLERLSGGDALQRRFLDPLFFGTLNTPPPARAAAARAFGRVPFLNGGLFARSGLERRCRALRLRDDALAAIIGELLARYRLTARETTSEFSDAAVDPAMLGRAFESLMSAESRKSHGAFYTPHALTARIAARALETVEVESRSWREIRILDPACGSGAFLVVALELLAARAAGPRREILAHCIYGVDRDPVAVWLCQLRLWLSVVVDEETDDPMQLPPLPNLDRNIREGDALAGQGFEGPAVPCDPRIARQRLRYVRASGARKRTLARLLERAERQQAINLVERRMSRLVGERRELLLAARSPDLFRARRGLDAASRRALESLRETLRADRATLRRLRDGGALDFGFGTHFAEVAASGGFDLVLGNPPWVRPHAVAAASRAGLRDRFESGRNAAWESGATAAAAGRGFGSQADLAALFTERSVQLVRPRGVVSLLLPSKLWSALAGGGIRAFLDRRTTIHALDEWSGDGGFDASVYPTALLATVEPRDRPSPIRFTRFVGEASTEYEIAPDRLALDESPGAPWLLLPPDVRDAFDRLAAAGPPLAATPFGRPLLGVKTGCNEAFIVNDAEVEPELLRPLLRGEDLASWRRADDARLAQIIWTHDRRGEPLAVLPPGARRWLSRWRRDLEQRTDGRSARWWALFRTESARFDCPRVVWADIGRTPRAIVLAAGDTTVPLNTCYVVRANDETDAHALASLLNSRVMASWLAALAEPARGGYRRYFGWTCARLPVPRDWLVARVRLAAIGRAARERELPDPDMLDAAVATAFGVPLELLAPLIRWRGE